MEGSGTLKGGNLQLSYGLELRCRPASGRNRLDVRWTDAKDGDTSEHLFRLEDVSVATCSGDRSDAFDTHRGSGRGRFHGQAGATVEWSISDKDAPKDKNRATIKITDERGRTVLHATGALADGDNRAHDR
jgi:hypothetical protein